jgi:leucyl aminopeptidase (aminopeptidase T)
VITEVVRNIFRVNLGLKKTERVLVFTDRPSSTGIIKKTELERRSKLKCIAYIASEIGKGFSKELVFHEFQATEGHGVEPPLELWEIAFGKKAVTALKKTGILNSILKKKAQDSDIKKAEVILNKFKNDAVNAIIALSNFSTSHTRFRDFLTRVCCARYASMPLFDMSMLEGPLNINWRYLAKITKEIARKVNKAECIELKTENGSNLSFSKKGRKALSDTGILTKPGAFGNLPAGEAYLAPVEGSSHGRLVLEWAPTRELKSPVTLIVKDGYVKDVLGSEEYSEQLREKLSERHENGNIAELGIGTNNRAKRPDNILESEKIMGTIHIALGDNSSFGGVVKTPFHQDFVFFKPTVTLIHKDKSRTILIKKGKFER